LEEPEVSLVGDSLSSTESNQSKHDSIRNEGNVGVDLLPTVENNIENKTGH